MNKKKLIILLVLMFTLTGCVKTFKNEGKFYTENILCRPEKSETIEIYKDNKVNVDHLPRCEDFKISDGGYEGVWATIFVKPLAFVLVKLGQLLKSYGAAIISATLLLRLILMPVTAKTARQSENLKNAQPELNNLERKYKDKKDKESLIQKSQEQMLIYKKYNIKPLSGCLFMFLQIPLFFAFLEAINRLPVLFDENFLGIFELRSSPLEALKMGHYYYLIFIVLIILSTHFSFKLNKTASISKEQEDQMNKTKNIMVVMISIISFNLTIGIALYWVINNAFTIFQNLLIMRGNKNVKVV